MRAEKGQNVHWWNNISDATLKEKKNHISPPSKCNVINYQCVSDGLHLSSCRHEAWGDPPGLVRNTSSSPHVKSDVTCRKGKLSPAFQPFLSQNAFCCMRGNATHCFIWNAPIYIYLSKWVWSAENGLEPAVAAGEGLTIYRRRKCSSDESPPPSVEVTDTGIPIAITHALERTLSRNYL